LQQILRGRLGFEGAVFSDDLSMEAARSVQGELLSYTDAALAALDAGCDLALLCNQSIGESTVLDEVLAGFAAARRGGRWTPEPACEARRRRLLPRSNALPWDALMREPAYRQAAATLSKL
jgi:beta-N-acetylhexosaminidase